MILLCMDGLDSELSSKLKLHMKYEVSPIIESELCIQLGGALTPHTMLVWPSMFTGQVVKHPDIKTENAGVKRIFFRNMLHKLGIKWKRKGTQIIPHKTDHGIDRTQGIPYSRSIELKETVFGNHDSLLYQIPGLVDNFLLGGTEEWYTYEHKIWGLLANLADKLPYEIIALYTRQPDHLGHRKRNPSVVYRECFTIAKKLEGDVMILSDHGCSMETGAHTMNGYIGANFPFKAESMLDVRTVIEERMEN